MPSSPSTKRAVKRRLADGTVKTYYYDRHRPPQAPYGEGTIGALIAAYQRSPEFQRLAPRSKESYLRALGHFQPVHSAPVASIRRRDILATRDALAVTRGPAAASVFVRVTGTLMSWALDREWIEFSPATKLRNLPGGQFPAWTEAQLANALAGLPEPLRRVVVLGVHTGQRRSDLITIPWIAYQDGAISLRQQKTGAALIIPAHIALRAELATWAKERRAVTILETQRGVPWHPTYLSRLLGEELQKLGLPAGLNVHGLRKLASARLAQAGCSPHEIAAITGHRSLSMIQHYTRSADQERLAKAAVLRLENELNVNGKSIKKQRGR